LAAIHAGALSSPAIENLRDPGARKFWGVDGAATVAVPQFGDVERFIIKFEFGGESYEVYRHPHLFITEEITAWYQERRWVERAGAGARYGETNPKNQLLYRLSYPGVREYKYTLMRGGNARFCNFFCRIKKAGEVSPRPLLS